ncbi:MAG: HD domain-containing phosphohydrolase [Ardenticatenaceae bacterium]
MNKTSIKLLLVEDNTVDQEHFERTMKEEKWHVECMIADSVSQARAILRNQRVDLLVVDDILGDGSGFDLFDLAGQTPIIFMTGLGDEDVALKALQRGAHDYIIKDKTYNYLKLMPRTIYNTINHKTTEERWRPIQFERNAWRSIAGVYRLNLGGQLLECNDSFANILGYATRNEALVEWRCDKHLDFAGFRAFTEQVVERKLLLNSELRLRNKQAQTIYVLTNAGLIEEPNSASQVIEGTLIDITKQKEAEREVRALKEELQHAYEATLEGWSQALDLRDKETKGHSERVTEMALRLARAMGLDQDKLVHIRRGALLHDIGKLGIPDGILLKQGSLTTEEWSIMRRHPDYAYKWLTSIDYLRPALEIPYCHHERWDGTGYPRGLKGEEIPLSARIFTVVDIWDALLSDRPYRPSWSKEQVREYIRSLAGTHLDPQVVKVFLEITKEEAKN